MMSSIRTRHRRAHSATVEALEKGPCAVDLGSFPLQPRNFRLNSRRLDQLIAGSDEVIFPGAGYVSSIAVSLMTEVVKSDRNPGGATLQSLMSVDAYAKWLALRQKYSNGAWFEQSGPKFAWQGTDGKWVALVEPYRGGDGIDSLRPTFAWDGLRRAAMGRHGLAGYDLESALSTLAKSHNVPVQKLHYARQFLWVLTADPILDKFPSRKFNAAEVLDRTDYGDIDCLTANLDLLDPLIEMRKVQASAWAAGDLATFRGADTGARLRDCVNELVATVSAGAPGYPAALMRRKRRIVTTARARTNIKAIQKGWMSAVQDAVKRNKVTFSMVLIDQLLANDGYLAALRDKGFLLEESGQAQPE